MVFSSEVFLFGFLPLALGLYFVIPWKPAKNALLVLLSLAFYAWGEGGYVFLVVGLAVINYALAHALSALPDAVQKRRRALVAIAIVLDIGTLVFFKYTAFLLDTLGTFVPKLTRDTPLVVHDIYVPLGVSFFTFHAVSYVVDVYRRTSRAESSPLETLLYFVFFPQLLAGPIVRYKDIADQLRARIVTLDDLAYGIRRFVVGLAKKVLIADTLARPVDQIFATPPASLSSLLAWFAVLAYALQIYYDFSGYSDMAIGLARMFGFRFLENFEFPYVAGSIREFWSRWNISLSRWMRDYLYIPLGGNRVAAWRAYLNLFIVFFLCGLWHGAKWTFVIWGLIHGAFMVLERVGALSRIVKRPVIRNIYAVSIVGFAWVFFRSDSLGYALGFFRTLILPTAAPALTFGDVVDHEVLLVAIVGCMLAAPWASATLEKTLAGDSNLRVTRIAAALTPLGIVILFVGAVAKLATGSYHPFIYFRF